MDRSQKERDLVMIDSLKAYTEGVNVSDKPPLVPSQSRNYNDNEYQEEEEEEQEDQEPYGEEEEYDDE